jgi:glyoxylase-like metal-dependent hydrolase (beta-lactamase superfamily II)
MSEKSDMSTISDTCEVTQDRNRSNRARTVLTHEGDAASFLCVHYDWERLTGSVHRCRLPFCDVTIGLVQGGSGALVVDTGTTLVEAAAIDADVRQITGCRVTYVVLTHKHFDHVLGSSQFDGAEVFCAPEVVEYLSSATDRLRDDALSYGADAGEVDRAIAALKLPQHGICDTVIDLGGRSVTIAHLGRGHTTADLIAVAPDPDDEDAPVVFTGDLVEESGDPCIDLDSDLQAWPATLDRVLAVGGPDAIYVPGHGSIVDAGFIRRQRDWLRERAVREIR